jgi:hypothetical protein
VSTHPSYTWTCLTRDFRSSQDNNNSQLANGLGSGDGYLDVQSLGTSLKVSYGPLLIIDSFQSLDSNEMISCPNEEEK